MGNSLLMLFLVFYFPSSSSSRRVALSLWTFPDFGRKSGGKEPIINGFGVNKKKLKYSVSYLNNLFKKDFLTDWILV